MIINVLILMIIFLSQFLIYFTNKNFLEKNSVSIILNDAEIFDDKIFDKKKYFEKFEIKKDIKLSSSYEKPIRDCKLDCPPILISIKFCYLEKSSSAINNPEDCEIKEIFKQTGKLSISNDFQKK